MVRDFRLTYAGVVSGGFWARVIYDIGNIPRYLLVCAAVYGAVELVAYLRRHLRWTSERA